MKIGDKLQLSWVSMTGNVSKKEWSEFEGKVVIITKHVFVLENKNGIRESFNYSQILDKNLEVKKKISRKFEILDKEDKRKEFECLI